jgi:uncharacterized protein YvpB
MNKPLGFVIFSFVVLVGLNWTFLQLPSLAATYPVSPRASTLVQTKAAKTPPTLTKEVSTATVASKVPSHAKIVQVVAQQVKNTTVANVPFFSQFTDIQSPQWQGVGCGITSLAMMIDFYKPDAVSVNNLLQQGINAGAYDQNNGWNFGGLIQLAQQYGLTGDFVDLSKLTAKTAIAKFDTLLNNGPVILSVHNKFNPKDSLPHLVVIDGINNNFVYYNDPAAKTGQKKISITNLAKGWEKKMIVLRPAKPGAGQLGMLYPNTDTP